MSRIWDIEARTRVLQGELRALQRDPTVIVIGPECFASLDGEVISWRGRNYVPQETMCKRENETE
jgi:hypothetical protein